jgi:hypothetical protein
VGMALGALSVCAWPASGAPLQPQIHTLSHPEQVVTTSGGGFLIADTNNEVIRQVTIPPTTTIALSPASPDGRDGWYVTNVHATVSAVRAVSTNCELDPTVALTVYQELPAGCAYTGPGGTISGIGAHALYAASIDAAGDMEIPVSASLTIDTTPPTLRCNGTPSFLANARHELVTATLADGVSGPASAQVSAGANTTSVGRHEATVTGVNNAGDSAQIKCAYTVLPLKLDPSPGIKATFAAGRHATTVRRLVVTDVPPGAAVNVACHGTGCPFSVARDVTGKKCKRRPCEAKSSKHFLPPAYGQPHTAIRQSAVRQRRAADGQRHEDEHDWPRVVIHDPRRQAPRGPGQLSGARLVGSGQRLQSRLTRNLGAA